MVGGAPPATASGLQEQRHPGAGSMHRWNLPPGELAARERRVDVMPYVGKLMSTLLMMRS